MKEKVSILSIPHTNNKIPQVIIFSTSDTEIIKKDDWYWDEIIGLNQKESDLKCSAPLPRYKILGAFPQLRGTFKINRTFIKEWMKQPQPKIEIEYHYPEVIIDRTRENNEGHCPICRKTYEWICSPGGFHCYCSKIIDVTDKSELICSLLPVINFKDATMQDLADRGYPSPLYDIGEDSTKPSNADIFGWLEKQKYQTEYEETGEYKMYFEIDMPKILEDYYRYRSKLK